MGSRPWAIGTVGEVGDKFLRMEPAGSRISKMKSFAGIFGSQLPLIISCRHGKLTIDDGSHRAVAMYLVRIKKEKAYVGFRKKEPKQSLDRAPILLQN